MTNSKEEKTDRLKGFEEALQVLETFKEVATKVIEELIRKPAENKTYNYQVYNAPCVSLPWNASKGFPRN